MRAATVLSMLTLVGCAPLLDIQDPIPVDAPQATEHLSFGFTEARIAEHQLIQLRVQLVHVDGSTQDVTATAAVSSNAPAIAAIEAGRVVGKASAGTATITAQLDGADPATLAVTARAGACHPVINEIATHGASGSDEWVEIYNPCDQAIAVDGWLLVYRSANQIAEMDEQPVITLAGTLASRELRLYAGMGYAGQSDAAWLSVNGFLQQNNGAVGLRSGATASDPLVDAMAYGSVAVGHPFIEARATAAMERGVGAARQPFDGNDSDDGGADFVLSATRTPRTANAP